METALLCIQNEIQLSLSKDITKDHQQDNLSPLEAVDDFKITGEMRKLC